MAPPDPSAPAQPIDLRGGDVRLRPFVPEDLEPLVAARDRPGGIPLGDASEEHARRRLTRMIERSGKFHDRRLDLAIDVGGRLVGSIEARQPREGLPPGVFEIGISLFEEGDRGRGHGTAAVELLAGYLFHDPETHRIQASTDVTNDRMRRVLERLGFVHEGVMRAFMPGAAGERRDYSLYGVTREEWASRPKA